MKDEGRGSWCSIHRCREGIRLVDITEKLM
jgi:hypothetical protein